MPENRLRNNWVKWVIPENRLRNNWVNKVSMKTDSNIGEVISELGAHPWNAFASVRSLQKASRLASLCSFLQTNFAHSRFRVCTHRDLNFTSRFFRAPNFRALSSPHYEGEDERREWEEGDERRGTRGDGQEEGDEGMGKRGGGRDTKNTKLFSPVPQFPPFMHSGGWPPAIQVQRVWWMLSA